MIDRPCDSARLLSHRSPCRNVASVFGLRPTLGRSSSDCVALILTFPVVLEQQLAVLADRQRMEVVHLAILFSLGKTVQEFV